MTTSTANLPVHGHSLFAAASTFLSGLFDAPTAPAKAELAKPVAAAATTASDAGPDIWKMYRMSTGMDSVNPALLTGLIGQD